MKLIERPKAQEVRVHIYTPVSEQNLGLLIDRGQQFQLSALFHPILACLFAAEHASCT